MNRTLFWMAAASLGLGMSTPVCAQHVFINRVNLGPDAVAFEHAVKKLASYDTNMATLDRALDSLAKETERFSRFAQRPASYYAVQREFERVVQRYIPVRDLIEEHSDWTQGNPRRLNWNTLQDRFDRLYVDIHGYDLLDPYFGRHPDFAAAPVPIRIQRDVPPPPVPYRADYRVPVEHDFTPVLVPETRGTPRQF